MSAQQFTFRRLWALGAIAALLLAMSAAQSVAQPLSGTFQFSYMGGPPFAFDEVLVGEICGAEQGSADIFYPSAGHFEIDGVHGSSCTIDFFEIAEANLLYFTGPLECTSVFPFAVEGATTLNYTVPLVEVVGRVVNAAGVGIPGVTVSAPCDLYNLSADLHCTCGLGVAEGQTDDGGFYGLLTLPTSAATMTATPLCSPSGPANLFNVAITDPYNPGVDFVLPDAPVCIAPDQCHVVGCDTATGSCLYPPAADGTLCDDGNACTATDVCESGVCVGTVKDCTPSDQCHDAGVCDPFTGTCSNPPAQDGTFCVDGDPCTTTAVCESGVCVGSGRLTCDPCEVCDTQLGCVVPTDRGCQHAPSSNSGLTVKEVAGNPAKNQVTWKWSGSGTLNVADFGDPANTSGYTMCLIDQTGGTPTLRASATVPAGGMCAGRPCWKMKSTGASFKDEGAAHGLNTLGLEAGTPGKLKLKGRGAALLLPPLGLTSPATLRLQRTDGPECWEATFSHPSKNNTSIFKAKSD